MTTQYASRQLIFVYIYIYYAHFIFWFIIMTIKKTPPIAEQTPPIQTTESDNIISQEQIDKQSQLQDALQEKNIAQTLEFFLWENPRQTKWIMEEVHDKLSLAINRSQNEDLSWAIVIMSDYADKNTNMMDYAWIDKAFNLMIQDTSKKIILMDIIVANLDDYQNYKLLEPIYEKYKDKIQMMKQTKNLRFFHYSTCDFINTMTLKKLFREETQEIKHSNQNIRQSLQWSSEEEKIKKMEDMVKSFWFDTIETSQQMSFENKRIELAKAILEYKPPETLEVKITTWESDEAFQNVIANEITSFLHSRSNRDHMLDEPSLWYEQDLPKLFNLPEDQKSKNRLDFEDKLIALLHIQHPSFRLLPRQNNLQWIVDTFKYVNTKLLHEWQRFEGVFVDRDGTLYDNKKQQFNQNIIDMIIEHEKQWKKIIIWSGWNLQMKQELLDNHPQLSHYKIQSKTDYKWWTVEIAIDNDPQELLRANAKIKSEKHIKV